LVATLAFLPDALAQLLAMVTGFLFLWQGADKLVALWSAMLGVSLYRIYIITRGKT